MRIIKKISNLISEELEGAECYIRAALKYKDEHPSAAKVMYEISLDEVDHMNTLHNEVVKIIEVYRREHGEPPETMQAVYEYVHEKLIDKANKIKIYQDQYKNM